MRGRHHRSDGRNEFITLINETSDDGPPDLIARRLLDATRQPFELDGASSRRVDLEFDLRPAATGDQFRLVYQPIYNLDDLTAIR